MKQKLKHYLKLGIVLFSAAFLITTCEKENSLEENYAENTDVVKSPTIKTLTLDEVGDVFNRLSYKYQISSYFQSALESDELSRSTQDTLGLTIYTDVIKEITLDNYTSYTMRVEVPNTETTDFYNLTVEEKNGETDLILIKYTPTDYWTDNKTEPYQGTVEMQRIEDITHEFPNGGSGETGYNIGPTNNNNYPINCQGTVIIVGTNTVPYTCGCGDWPWQTCQGSSCGPPHLPGYTYENIYQCIESQEGDANNTNPNDTNTNTGGGGQTGGSSTPDNTSITMVVPPGEECNLPPDRQIYDLDGNCRINFYEGCFMNGYSDEVCECVADGGTVVECLENIKCERLNRLVQADGLGSNILPVVNQLRAKLSAGNNEWSISYKNVWSEDGRTNVPDDGGILEGPSDERSPFNYGNTWVGFIHTHPEGKFNIFSWLDIRALKLVHTNSNDDFNDEVFIMAVAPNNVTYALKVDNIQTLIDKIDTDMQNAEGNDDDEKRDYIMGQMIEKYTDSNNLEQKFLELYSDYGISLYEATDANLSNWKQLELDENNNLTVTETPCN